MNFEELTLKPVGYRGISEGIAKKYNILTGFNEGGKEVTRHYPYPHATKVRVLPKDFSKNKGFTNDYLLGMSYFNASSSKKITIVEGEDDWGSALELLGDRWPVVALPGAGTVSKVLKNPECYDYLKSYEKIYIATDSDKMGDKSAEELSRAFPNKCYRVKMTKHKDPNEYLVNGDNSDFIYAWTNAQKFVPENIFHTKDQLTGIIKDGKGAMYLPTGIKDFDDKTLGLFQGYFTVFQAPEGVGKTEFMRMLEWSIISNHPTVPIAVMHLEETKKRSLLGLASYALNKNVTLQDTADVGGRIEYIPSYLGTPEEEVNKVIEGISEQENFYQFTLSVDDDPNDMLEQVRYLAEVCGCKYVFFEPIQDLAYSRIDDSSTEAWLSQFSTRLARLCSELDVGVITVAHENDDGQIRDCRMIGKRAGVVLKLERDKMSTDEDTQNTTHVTIVKNRPIGTTGYACALEFDSDTFTLKEKY